MVFGRSDTRENLRNFFEIDKYHIIIAAMDALCDEGKLSTISPSRYFKKYNINSNSEHPWSK